MVPGPLRRCTLYPEVRIWLRAISIRIARRRKPNARCLYWPARNRKRQRRDIHPDFSRRGKKEHNGSHYDAAEQYNTPTAYHVSHPAPDEPTGNGHCADHGKNTGGSGRGSMEVQSVRNNMHHNRKDHGAEAEEAGKKQPEMPVA